MAENSYLQLQQEGIPKTTGEDEFEHESEDVLEPLMSVEKFKLKFLNKAKKGILKTKTDKIDFTITKLECASICDPAVVNDIEEGNEVPPNEPKLDV